MRITSLGSRRTAVLAATTLSLAAASMAGVALAPSASATAVALTLSATSGPTAGGNSITATSAANTFLSTTAVEFQYKTSTSTTCSSTYTASGANFVPVTSLHILTQKKIAVTVPTGVVLSVAGGSATSANWLMCSYTDSVAGTSAVTGTAAYTVATAPTVSAGGISPASGPALGGGTVTITGSGFTPTTTAMIGTVPLTGITIIDGTHLTGIVPPQAAGAAMSVSVTTVGGTGTRAALYTYTNGIVISPDTAPTLTAATDIDVQGVGFSSLNFTTTTGVAGTRDDVNAHVYVVTGQYLLSGSAKTVGEVGECINVLPISDTELICTVDTALSYGAVGGSPLVNGTYTISVVGSGLPAAPTSTPVSIISSGSTFTVAPY